MAECAEENFVYLFLRPSRIRQSSGEDLRRIPRIILHNVARVTNDPAPPLPTESYFIHLNRKLSVSCNFTTFVEIQHVLNCYLSNVSYVLSRRPGAQIVVRINIYRRALSSL